DYYCSPWDGNLNIVLF
nr:immunoglobulin light chain junction region [Macaca mulatta]MOW67136.1 immunoglobulin light chain junction region [Macaca mulatta]MOW67163.1 immunoglobulin light chain junction region [Macaca mulatta]MOW67174.1 immunoglobulin light chain junction region [Macaca mulatta]MOW67678.1 immunoglobulin light chain junction region [Macaca mulatta]